MANGQGYQSSVWPGEINTAVLDPTVTKVAGKVTFIPIPAGKSGKGVGMMGNWLLGVPKASKNQQAAADFIKWMLQADTQKTYAQNNGIPSRTSVLKDPSLQAANPYFSVLADAFQAPPNWRPRTDQWNAVEAVPMRAGVAAATDRTDDPRGSIPLGGPERAPATRPVHVAVERREWRDLHRSAAH